MNRDISIIIDNINFVSNIFANVISIMPSFDLLDKKILPYGLKPHTRSVSWIVEQVATQQAKFNARTLGLKDVCIDLPDTCLHDCILILSNDIQYFVNIKITQSAKKDTKNDIAAVEKLFMQYKADPNYNIVYMVLGFNFINTTIRFDKNYIHAFSPQFLPIYVNPRNDKLQAFYKATPIYRTRKEFMTLLKQESKSIVLSND